MVPFNHPFALRFSLPFQDCCPFGKGVCALSCLLVEGYGLKCCVLAYLESENEIAATVAEKWLREVRSGSQLPLPAIFLLGGSKCLLGPESRIPGAHRFLGLIIAVSVSLVRKVRSGDPGGPAR